jgi:hypothetical protein
MLADIKTYATKNDKFFKDVTGHTDDVKNKVAHLCNMLKKRLGLVEDLGGNRGRELMSGPAVPAHIASIIESTIPHRGSEFTGCDIISRRARHVTNHKYRR